MIGIRETKTNGGRAPAINAGGVLTFPDVDDDLTPLSVMLYELTTFIHGDLSDSQPLRGGIQNLGKSLYALAGVASPDSFSHPCGLARRVCGLKARAQWLR